MAEEVATGLVSKQYKATEQIVLEGLAEEVRSPPT